MLQRVYLLTLPEQRALLPVATSLQGRHAEAVESLLTLEKQSRLSEDITSTKMCCKAILDVLYNAKDWQQLNEHILLLAKRRSQLKQVSDGISGCYLPVCLRPQSHPHASTVSLTQAVQAFVRQAMDYVEKTPDKATKIELIKTLQSVTEGKVSVLMHALCAPMT